MARRYGFFLFVALALLALAVQGSTQGVWTSKAPMIGRRYAHAAAALDGKIHAVGGADPASCFSLPFHDVYDPATDVWTPGTSMAIGRAHAAAAVLKVGVNDLLFVVGGSTNCGVRTASMEAYDPVLNTWTSKAPMPGGPRSNMGAAVIDGLLYVVGGMQFDAFDGMTSLVEVYNPATDTWSTVAPLPEARYSVAVGAIDGILYAAGGSGTEPDPTGVFAYDPATDTWSSKAPISEPRVFAASAVANGLFYVIGGQYFDYLSSVEVYDPATNSWTAGPSLPAARTIMPAATAAGAIFVMGGGYDEFTFEPVTDNYMLADAIAPVTTATLSGAPNANGWFNSDVTVTLHASDGALGSGVQSIFYFLPNSNNNVPGDSVELNFSEGDRTLTYQAADNAGNIETLHALPIRIDKTAPTLPTLPNLRAVATSADGAVVNFSLTPFENGSGVASMQVTPLSSGMTFPLGTTHETVTVIDNAGNSVSAEFDVTVYPDRPHISIIGGTFLEDGNPHPASATAVDRANNPIDGTMTIAYLPGGAAPAAPGRYSATASFTSNNAGFTNAFPWTTMAPDPLAKKSPAVVEINGKLYVHGFDDDGGGSPGLPRLSIYDPASDTWTVGASPSLVRSQVSVGVINGKMFVAGGCISADCEDGTTNALEVYDPASNTWSDAAPMPTARFGAAAGAIGGKLYVAGGTTACDPCTPTTATEIYDAASDTWSAGAAIPVSRELAAAASVNGRLYVIGGFQRTAGDTMNGGVVATVHSYDPGTDSWSVRAPMPTARHAAAAGVVLDTIYVAGGYSTATTGVMERYDPGVDAWTPQVPMTTARPYTSGAVIDQNFYVIDGTDSASLNTNEVFDSSLTTTITINPGDQTPPTTTANYTQPNANGYHSLDVNVFLSALDSGGPAAPSGVQSITYTLTGAQTWGGTFLTSNNTSFTISNEGTTTVTYHATDNRGNVEADQSFTVKLDKTAPSAATLPNLTVAATSAAGAVVTFDLAESDSFSGIDTVTFNQGLPSGSTFPHGPTFESITIKDKAGNSTFRSFNVTVTKTLVSIAVQPASATVVVGQGGQQFQAMGHFTDGSDQLLPTQNQAVQWQSSNSSVAAISSTGFASADSVGQTTIIASSGAISCEPSSCGTLTVADLLTINLSSNIVAEATSALGAGVPFTVSATYSLGGSEPVQCFIITGFVGGNPQIGPSVSPGATFPLGTTTVGCIANGVAEQQVHGFFTITVQDTTAPVVTTSGNVTINATSPAGAVATFSASAIDIVDGARPVTCTPASGSAFAIGVTTVTCSASDASLHTGSATLTVTVLGPQQIIANLIAQATAAHAKTNLLQNALQSLSDGDTGTACSQLSAFINQVQAQTGKSISPADAPSLIQGAMAARAAIGC
jgi:N-acetylneuraminic acid mutarotase